MFERFMIDSCQLVKAAPLLFVCTANEPSLFRATIAINIKNID
jgi:hypothetical protein